MSSDIAKITVIITVVVINNFKYLTSAQSFGIHPFLLNPFLFNRRMLPYPNNFFTWPRPPSTCCSNSNAELIQKHGVITLKHYESTTYSTNQIEYSKNLGQHDPRMITTMLQRASLATTPWSSKEQTPDYIYWSGLKNRLRLRNYSAETLMKNTQNENSSKHMQYLYLSTTEKLIRSEGTETYTVSVKPTKIIDAVEGQPEEHLTDGFIETSTAVQSEEIKVAIKSETVVKNVGINDFKPELVSEAEETINFQSRGERCGLTRNEKYSNSYKSTTFEDCDNKSNPAVATEKVLAINEIINIQTLHNDTVVLDTFLRALDDLERTFYLVGDICVFASASER